VLRFSKYQLAVQIYGAGSWSVNKDIAKRLAAFGRKVLRRMFWGALREMKTGESDIKKN
jgi:hypothetical protein